MTPHTLYLDAQRSTLLSLQRFSHHLRRPPLPPHLQVGLRGELEALFHLRRNGYHVIERRWRTPDHNGDLDLIAWDADTLCFIEVKTRSVRDLTPAASAVDALKRKTLRRMAGSFLRTLPRDQRDETLVRFDLISVYLAFPRPECELLRDAFPWREPSHPGYGV